MLSQVAVGFIASNIAELEAMGSYYNGQEQLLVQSAGETKIKPKGFARVLVPTLKLCGGIYYSIRLTYEMQLKGLLMNPISLNLNPQDTPEYMQIPVHNMSDEEITISDQEDLCVFECYRVQH